MDLSKAKVLFSLLLLLFIAGCNDSEKNSFYSSQYTYELESGQFVDDPVAGLSYECSSGLKGVTDQNGTFSCYKGDKITFKLSNRV